MLRRLLACLALLTGLATAGMPAQAEAMAAASRIEASATGVAHSDRRVQQVVQTIVPRREIVGFELLDPAAPASRPAPSVRLRSDRSRE